MFGKKNDEKSILHVYVELIFQNVKSYLPIHNEQIYSLCQFFTHFVKILLIVSKHYSLLL